MATVEAPPETDASRAWIQTRSGKKFFPLDPDPALIEIEDIAAALSKLCRFGGHCARYYSVAEHSSLIASEVACQLLGPKWMLKYAGRDRLEAPPAVVETLKAALLDDATEAYLVDLPRPIKVQPQMFPYRDAEKKVKEAIWLRFNLPHVHGTMNEKLIRDADNAMLKLEAHALMQPLHGDWSSWLEGVDLPAQPFSLWMYPLDPEMAEASFLSWSQFLGLT